MAFLMKIAELQRSLNKTVKIASETAGLIKKEGIDQENLNKELNQLSDNLKKAEKEIASFLSDKQSTIEEIEFLMEAFRLEYATILNYRKYASLVENKEVASRFRKFGKEETKHANELIQLIYERGGKPTHTFKEEKQEEQIKKEVVMASLIEDEEKAVEFYESGLKKYGDTEFGWLIGNIKLDEVEHLKELKKLGKEFEDKEIVIRSDPDFKWVDPYMGEPGDRAWIE